MLEFDIPSKKGGKGGEKGDCGAVEKVYIKWSILKEIHPSM